MTTNNTTNVTHRVAVDPITALKASGDDLAGLVAAAADGYTIAAEPLEVGDHGLVIRRPADWDVEVIDIRALEDYPRERSGTFAFAGVASLCAYVNRYKSDSTLGYIADVTGRGPAALTTDTLLARYVLDDFAAWGADELVANRRHTATLTLRPTTAARRWGAVLGKRLTQAELVDLVAEGVKEIAHPPAADLRDLISDLHAIRTTGTKSVIRTGGEVALELTDNVALHAGPGNRVTVPDKIIIALQPWTAIEATIYVDILVRPTIVGEQVFFRLDAPTLEDALNEQVKDIAGHIGSTADGTGITPYLALNL